MALFERSELDAKPQEQTVLRGMGLWVDDTEDVMALDDLTDLHELVRWMEPGRSLHYYSDGLWSVHDMLFAVLDLTGPADVWLATWTITEEPVQKLIGALDSGQIRTLRGIFDTRVQIRSEAVYHYAKLNLVELVLTAIHAKVTVVENEAWAVVINGSQNYTRNPRIEAGVLTVSRKLAAFHKHWMQRELDEKREK